MVVWEAKSSGKQALGTHRNADFVVDELAELFIQVPLAPVDIG